MAGLEQPNLTSLLFLTRHHLYIWDKFTDSLTTEFRIKSCSILVSPSSTSKHVHLCIQTRPSTDKEELAPDSGYEMVRQYLQHSITDIHGQQSVQDSHDQQLPHNQQSSVAGEGLAADPGKQGDTPPAAQDVGGGEGLVLCLGGLWAEQFCAVWDSMTRDAVPPYL